MIVVKIFSICELVVNPKLKQQKDKRKYDYNVAQRSLNFDSLEIVRK